MNRTHQGPAAIASVPGRNAHKSGHGTSGPAPLPLGCTSGNGHVVRRLVASAIEQRKRLLRNGRGHIKASALVHPFAALEAWLGRTNDWVSSGSLRDFWRMHGNEVRLVMPGTKGGARTLQTLERLCA